VVKDCFVPHWRGFDKTCACETGDLFVNLARDAPHHRVLVLRWCSTQHTEMVIPIHYVSIRKKAYQARAVLKAQYCTDSNTSRGRITAANTANKKKEQNGRTTM
jgi:hypothetical protein